MLRVTSQGLRPTQTVEVCVGASCVAANAAGGVTFTDIAQPPTGIVEVSVRVRDGGTLTSEQRQNRPSEDFRPNGAGCPPTWKRVDVVVSEHGFA
jgi:hypothetical protein